MRDLICPLLYAGLLFLGGWLIPGLEDSEFWLFFYAMISCFMAIMIGRYLNASYETRSFKEGWLVSKKEWVKLWKVFIYLIRGVSGNQD